MAEEKVGVQIVAECYASTTVNIATVLVFFWRMRSLESLEKLESEHRLTLQTIQKHIRGLKIGLEAEMGFPVS